MKCEFGYCMLCEKEIAPPCGHCGSRKPGSQYTEVEVQWSNGSIMKIAVCVDCAVKNAHAADVAKDGLTKAHQAHWEKQGGTYDKAVVIV
jgi:hypothetical protein